MNANFTSKWALSQLEEQDLILHDRKAAWHLLHDIELVAYKMANAEQLLRSLDHGLCSGGKLEAGSLDVVADVLDDLWAPLADLTECLQNAHQFTQTPRGVGTAWAHKMPAPPETEGG